MLLFNRRRHWNDRVVSFTAAELSLTLTALIQFRNRAIRENLPTEDIDALILLLSRA